MRRCTDRMRLKRRKESLEETETRAKEATTRSHLEERMYVPEPGDLGPTDQRGIGL